jgi:hypothetical protein
LENKKTGADAPKWKEIIGAGAYMKFEPTCPGRGVLTLGDMAHKPRCSIPGHSLP